jgi:predicted amidohydrolase
MNDGVVVACAQIAPVVGQGEHNRRLARNAVREAVSAGADLVVLPELCTSGYVFESEEEARSLSQPADGPALQDWCEEVAAAGAVVVGGFCELGDDGRLYNSAAVVDGTGVRAVYRKAHLWDREKLVFEPGESLPPVVTTSVGAVGVAICHDVAFPEIFRGLAEQGAEVVAVPTNFPRWAGPDARWATEIAFVRSWAMLNRIFVATCDRSGAERGQEWIGGTVIVDPDGFPVAGPAGPDGPALLTARCDLRLTHDKAWSTRNHAFDDRRPDLYSSR